MKEDGTMMKFVEKLAFVLAGIGFFLMFLLVFIISKEYFTPIVFLFELLMLSVSAFSLGYVIVGEKFILWLEKS